MSAVYDSGSNVSLINEETLKFITDYIEKDSNSFIKHLSGTTVGSKRATLPVKIGRIKRNLTLVVMKTKQFNYDLLLGLDAIKLFKLMQDEELNIHQRKHEGGWIPIKHCATKEKDVPKKKKVHLIEAEKLNPEANEISEQLNRLDMDTTEEEKKNILNLLKRRKHIFAKNKFSISQYNGEEAKIQLIEDKIVNVRPYRNSLSDQKEINDQIKALLTNGLIEESTSEYNSPVALAYKRNEGKSRLVIDMRELNKVVKPVPHPFNRIEDMIDRLRDCDYFTTLDINSAFWTIRLKKECRKFTSFMTNRNKYQWTVLPFGMKTSPAIFQRILSSILRKGERADQRDSYIDDIIIFSNGLENHKRDVEATLKLLDDHKLKLKLSKCQFFKKKVEFLGHSISKNQFTPMNSNIEAILRYEEPKNKRQIRQFNGKINFQRKFIKNCTQKMSPLTGLLRKDAKFIWTDECRNSFNEIKRDLCNEPCLAIFNENSDCILRIDASIKGFGAELLQVQEDSKEIKPVGYFSCKISNAERKKPPVHLELLAIHKAIRYWHYYLHNRHFTVLSDHKPLKNLNLRAPVNTEIGNLANELAQYDFTINYVEGKENVSADALSRNPVFLEFNNREIFKTVNLIELDDVRNVHREVDDETSKQLKLIRTRGILFKEKNGMKRIYLNEDLAQKLIKRTHERLGHIGGTQLKMSLRRSYYFQNFDKMIDQFCKTCSTCHRNKSRRGKPFGYLSKIMVEKPFQYIAIDSVGGLKGPKTKKRFLHIAVDLFTRYVWLHSSNSQSAKDLVKLVEKIGNHDLIHTILVDQYSAFDSEAFKRCLREKSIQLKHTPVDHAASNGCVERLGQTIVNRLRCKMNECNQTKSWPTLVEEVGLEYNNTTHTVTKYSPELLMYGFEKLPTNRADCKPVNLEQIRQEARQNTKKYFIKNKKFVDRNRRQVELNVGDQVFAKICNKLNREKLDELRSGPFEIEEKLSENVFRLNTGRKKSSNNIFHKNDLIPVTS